MASELTDGRIESGLRQRATDESSRGPAAEYTSISAGGLDVGHNCALREDGTITCWGSNIFGESDAPAGTFKAVSAGGHHSCGLRDDSTVTCWGNNHSETYDVGHSADDYGYHYVGQSDAPAGTFKTVSAGGHHSCGLRDDSTVTCWGDNKQYGQSDAPAGTFKAVSAGFRHTCGLRSDDTVTCWGFHHWGQTDAPAGRFKAVSAGFRNTCGLRDDDTVACWGDNYWGQADAPAGTFKAVTLGRSHSCALGSDDTVTCWGANVHGQSDAPAGTFKSVSAGDRHTCGLRDDNTMTCWGNNQVGEGAPPTGGFEAVAVGWDFVCGILDDGTIVCWGKLSCNAEDAICRGDARYGQADVPAGRFKAIAVGTSHGCGLRSDDTVTCWAGAGPTGRNVGQLDAPAGRFKAISARSHHTCGLRSDNTVACWGANDYGQSDAPGGRFEAVTAGAHHSCGLREDGTVTCWGSNESPSFDWNSGFTRNHVGQADAPTGSFKAIAAGSYHTCGLRSDNTVACWGDPSVAPLGSFRAITAACGLRSDNTVTCWGHNHQGGPVVAPSGSFQAVASGIRGNCGLHSDNTVTCWGHPRLRTSAPVGLVESQGTVPDPPDTSLWVSLDSAAARLVRGFVEVGTFDVYIHFSAAVEGFTASDMRVSNGRVVSLTGSGRVYTAVIEPVSDGDVVVRVPADAARDGRDRGNQPSPPLIRTKVSDNSRRAPRAVDTWDRAVVHEAYFLEFDRAEPDWGYTGDVANCDAGTTSQRFRDSTFRRINWYRQMAGLGTVRENQDSSAGAQHVALMMLAEGRLSHEPASNWACYTNTGRSYAGANLVLGEAGTAAIDGFMQDRGEQNTEVGHRRWILHPQTREMGTGDARNARTEHRESSALWPRDTNTHSARPQVRERRGFVAWPPPGYAPPQVVWGRWSFSLAGADFSGASVNVSDDDGPVEADVTHRSPVPLPHAIRAPEETIVWAIGGDIDSNPLPAPTGGDHCYIVTITGVKINGTTQQPYEYTTCILGQPSLPQRPDNQ